MGQEIADPIFHYLDLFEEVNVPEEVQYGIVLLSLSPNNVPRRKYRVLIKNHITYCVGVVDYSE